MSDAIVLDVLSASPVQLDVGDADPIAREEIAELAERVDAVEGDVSALDGRLDTAEGDISTLGTTVDGIDARVEAIEADYVTSEDVMDALGGEAPTLVAGSATGILGDAETASWMERTTAADGAALIESVKGNTLRWNQLCNLTIVSNRVVGNSYTNPSYNSDTNTITAEATSETSNAYLGFTVPVDQIAINHKYLVKYHVSTSASNAVARDAIYRAVGSNTAASANMPTANVEYTLSHIMQITEVTSGATSVLFRVFLLQSVNPDTALPSSTTVKLANPQLFDLTAMFGAGNEPATVAEFEALFPEQYYPYDAGSLLPVRMEGVETVGFNQWDGDWEVGGINNATGLNVASQSLARTVGYIPMLPDTDYYLYNATGNTFGFRFYDANKAYIGNTTRDGLANSSSSLLLQVPAGTRYFRFINGSAPNIDTSKVCISVSGQLNGTYEPHWSSQLAIPASTYFPDGLRSAGSVHDELRADAAVTRVGAVDLGTLDWATYSTPESHIFRTSLTAWADAPASVGYSSYPDAECAKYEGYRFDLISASTDKKFAFGSDYNRFVVIDSDYTDAAAFKEAMSGVMLHYALATPTTTPIDPPLPLSYRTGAGGTERVMVASGTTSAPPIFATRYPLDPADLAASIAPVDGPIAKTNHQVGDLLMLGFTLCKATQVIVTGETIEIGTNVTRTSVATELAALSE